jgi:hypothetical protein
VRDGSGIEAPSCGLVDAQAGVKAASRGHNEGAVDGPEVLFDAQAARSSERERGAT